MCQNPNKPEQMSCLADQIHPLGVLEVPTCLVSTSACTTQNPLFFQNMLSEYYSFIYSMKRTEMPKEFRKVSDFQRDFRSQQQLASEETPDLMANLGQAEIYSLGAGLPIGTLTSGEFPLQPLNIYIFFFYLHKETEAYLKTSTVQAPAQTTNQQKQQK